MFIDLIVIEHDTYHIDPLTTPWTLSSIVMLISDGLKKQNLFSVQPYWELLLRPL